MSSIRSSRLPGFYRLPLAERRAALLETLGWKPGTLAALDADAGLGPDVADHMIENVVGTYALPFAVALNFRVNGRDVLVPMVVEEASVVAAAGNAARMIREGGGFTADHDPPIMIAQVQLLDVADPDAAVAAVTRARPALLEAARATLPRLCERGGGPVDVDARVLSRPGDPDGGQVVVHLYVDCRDAMGANLVNTLAEALAGRLAELAGAPARPGLRILSNLADRRLVRVSARVPVGALEADGETGTGAAVAAAIVSASRFAELDPYRAATHNKGIMNGVDAVLLATGNDWRAIEAGAHAYAARGGRYAPLATWRVDGAHLVGQLAMPMAVGTVGGALLAHPTARLAVELLGAEASDGGGGGGAGALAMIVGAAGLASNLAALRALATDGIQRGHMALHARVVARAVGADGELAERVAAEIAAAGDVKPERARAVLARLLAREADRTGDGPPASQLTPPEASEVLP